MHTGSGKSAPLFVHVFDHSGKGFTPAEQNPGEFHGVSAFDVNHLTDPDVAPDSSFSTVFGQQLAQLAGQDERICAITAAMKYGTGLQYFYKQHKSRFFDVGMAEQHAVTFAAGLAANGMRPVVSIYSTFLQRGYDQIIHDVNLQRLSVLGRGDRAGPCARVTARRIRVSMTPRFSVSLTVFRSLLPAITQNWHIGWNGSFWKTARVRCVTRAARRTKRWPLWTAAAWNTTCFVRKVPRMRRS